MNISIERQRTMSMTAGIVAGVLVLAVGLASSAWANAGNPVASPLTYNAATGYYNPPSWNSMVMVNITFDGYSLGWEPDSYDFTVGPILTVASAGTFDPSKSWSILNGTAFSRQLGWFDNVNDDFYYVARNPTDFGSDQPALPNDYYVWIEKIAGSSELKTYSVEEASNPSGSYTPIFGTDGSSTKWLWDGYMDHNAYAVDLADITETNQVFTATYRLYIGDANGSEIVNSQGDAVYGSTELTWEWIGPSEVPEPATLALLASGAVAMAARRRRDA
jgi:hypothetical protein